MSGPYGWVFEIREQTGQRKGALARVGEQLDINFETLRNWVNQAEVDGGPPLRCGS